MRLYTFEVASVIYHLYKCRDVESLKAVLNEEGAFVCTAPGDLTLLAPAGLAFDDYECVDRDWYCIKLAEPLDLDEIGVASEVTTLLAKANVSVLVMSGYAHDYFFVKAIEPATAALAAAGHRFTRA